MSDERIDIELNDKISPAIEQKFLAIAAAAREAQKSITALSEASGRIQKPDMGAAQAAAAMRQLEAVQSRTAASIVADQERIKRAQDATRAAYAKNADAMAASAVVANERIKVAQDRSTASAMNLSIKQRQLEAATSRAAAAAAYAARSQLNLKNAQSGTHSSTSQLILQLRNLYIGYRTVVESAQMLGRVVGEMDAYQKYENRLRAVGHRGQELKRVYKELIDTAVESRSALHGTIELYARMSTATRGLGYDQQQLLTVVSTISKAMSTSGSSTQEAHNALIQLSQGLSSGTLQGEELKSILEQLPVVADVIANKMGVARGQLKQLGAEGKITPKIIIEAFLEAKDSIESMFNETEMTVEQALTNLHTRTTEVLGSEGNGGLKDLVSVIKDLTDAVEDSGPVMEVMFFGVSSVIKILHVAMLEIENFFTVIIPTLGIQISKVMYNVANVISESLFPLLESISFLLPKSAAEGIKQAHAATASYILRSKQELNTMQDNAVYRGKEFLDKIAKIYAPEYEKSGMTAEAEARLQAQAQGKDTKDTKTNTSNAKDDTNITIHVKYPEAQKREIADPMGEMDKELDVLRQRAQLGPEEQKRFDLYQEMSKNLPELADMRTAVRTLEQAANAANEAYSRAIQQYEAGSPERLEARVAAVNAMTARDVAVENLQKAEASNKSDLRRQIDERMLYTYLNDQNDRRNNLRASIVANRDTFQQAYGDLRAVKQQRGDRMGAENINAITQQDYDRTLVGLNPDLFEGTKKAAKVNEETYKQMYENIAQMRRTNDLDEKDSAKARTNVWLKEHKSTINSWSGFFSNMSDLQESSNKQMAAAGKAFAEFQVALNGVIAITAAWASAPWPANIPAVAEATSAFAIQEAKLNNLAGFAFGGDFTVGGAGGIDSQTVAFRATPGEQVTITTPEQRAAKAKPVEIHYHDHVPNENKAEREVRFAQFARAMSANEMNHRKNRQQVAL